MSDLICSVPSVPLCKPKSILKDVGMNLCNGAQTLESWQTFEMKKWKTVSRNVEEKHYMLKVFRLTWRNEQDDFTQKAQKGQI